MSEPAIPTAAGAAGAAAADTARRIAALSPQQREMLLQRLRQEQDPATAAAAAPELPRIPEPGEHDRFAPAPLTDAQEAFWIGRSGIYDLGGSGSNVYLEYEFPENAEAFAERLGPALDRVIQRHEILRTIVLADGTMRLLEEVRPFDIQLVDLSAYEGDALEERLDLVREEMRYGRKAVDRWPLFEVVVHQIAGGLVRLHARFDALLLDGTARGVLLTELALVLANLETALTELGMSFLDFARAVAAFQETATWRRDRDYWMERLPHLPPPPRLPLARDVGPDTVPRIVKRTPQLLEPEAWQSLKQSAAQAGLTPSGLLTAAFAEALRPWCESPSFTLGIVGAYQPDVHPHLRLVIGTFNTVHILGVEDGPGSFTERTRQLQSRMTEDIDHQHFTGLRVLRELNRLHRSGPRATLPVLFDSVVEYSHSSYQPGGAPPAEGLEEGEETAAAPEGAETPEGTAAEAPAPRPPMIRLISTEIDLMISLPQVLLLFVALEEEGALNLITQAVEDVLPEHLVPGLIEDYRALLARLAADPASWQEARPGRPHPPAADGGAALLAGPSPLRLFEERLGLGAQDRILAVAPGEIAPSLPSGAAVLPAAPPWNAAALASRIAREGITACLAPAALLEAVLAAAERDRQLSLRSLRRVVLWGEAVPAGLPARLKALSPEIRIAAAWFDPETGVPAAASFLEDGDAGAPLRVEPLAGFQLLVLDSAHTPRPDGVAGDLHVRRRGETTRTGQRARRLADGRVELIDTPAEDAWPGRLGHGTDLQRLEAALQQRPGVRHAVVGRPDAGGDQLAAWIVPSAKAPSERRQARDLREHLRATFPEHRIPSAFVRLESLPLTRDGRIDREALPAPPPPAASPRPWTPRETELAALWEEVLGRRPAARGDDFFDLGGTSISAVRLLARLTEKHRIELPAGELFAHPTLAGMAEIVARAEKAARQPWIHRAVAWPARAARRLAGKPDPAAAPPSVFRESPTEQRESDGMRTFLILWFGQLVSGIGTGLGTFSLGVWIFQQNLSASQFTMVGFCAMVTGMLMMPVAGSLADRYDRRKLILYGDAAAAFMTLLLAIALATDTLRVWHVFPLAILMTAFSAVQGPALAASISTLVSRRQLIRAGTMSQLIGTIVGMTTPLMAGVLIGQIGFHGVILIDFSTFFVAAATLLYIRFPPIPRSGEAPPGGPFAVLRDLGLGVAYLRARPGLMSLLLLFALTNFSAAIVQALLTPLILSFGTAQELGTVSTAAAAGVLVGSLSLSVWGGPQTGRRVWAIFFCMIFQGCLLFLGGVQPSIPLVAAAMFLAVLTAPIVSGANTAIWQSKVAHEIQGRMFGLRSLIASAMAPLAFLLAGFLADGLFEPMLAPGGLLADSVGAVIGTGPGRGIGFLYILVGLFMIGVILVSFLNPRLRNVETELPDVPRPGVGGTLTLPSAARPGGTARAANNAAGGSS